MSLILERILRRVRKVADDDNKPKLLNVGNLLSTYLIDFKEPEWIFKDFIRKGDQVLISGRTGEGKSLVTMLMSKAIGEGKPFGFLGNSVARNILYLDAENDTYLISVRLKRLSNSDGLRNVKYWWGSEDPDYTLNICDPADQQLIIDYIKENDIHTVVFDNIFALTLMDDYMSTQEYQSAIKPLVLTLKKMKVTGIFLHHLNKKDEEYGSIGMKVFMDLCVKLTKEKDAKHTYFQFEVSKSRGFGLNDQELQFRVTDENEVIPYVAEVEIGSTPHYLTYMKNNWHKAEEGSVEKKIKLLNKKFEAEFGKPPPIAVSTVRTYHVKNF